MSIPSIERRDDIIYFLLNKAKSTEADVQDISYYPQDFEDKVVEKAEVQEHLVSKTARSPQHQRTFSSQQNLLWHLLAQFLQTDIF